MQNSRISQAFILPVISMILLPAVLAAQSHEFVISNEFGLHWPLDLTYLEIPGDALKEPLAVRIGGELRPAQLERVTKEDKTVNRVWFTATIPGGSNEMPVAVIEDQPATAGLTVKSDGDFALIDNGVYEFRVHRYAGLAAGTALGELPHWSGGMRLKGSSAWDGRAWFNGSSRVERVENRILNNGPVFLDMHLIYHFSDAQPDGHVEALPLELGKQCHLWEPNQPPRETIPKLSAHYEVMLRFTAGNPWIEVSERFYLPGDDTVEGWGIHQYYMHWGEPDENVPAITGFQTDAFMPLDTITWVRWFLYDRFGGNVNQHWVPARPREDQRGRPFALMRPRWNQGGGGSQDFFMTSGGPPPPALGQLRRDVQGRIRNARRDDDEALKTAAEEANDWEEQSRDLPGPEARKLLVQALKALGGEYPFEGVDDEAPAVGIVAAFASKWVGPYPNTIAAYAHDESRASVRFPLRDGDTHRSGFHYGQRSYGINIAPRRNVASINDIVRRHTDWTLVAQMNKYILSWERDPSKAGPNILMNRDTLERLRREYRDNTDTFAAQAIREAVEKRAALQTELAEVQESGDRRRAGQIRNELDSLDYKVLAVVLGEDISTPNPPSPGLWIQRRYQDDFLNPTSRQLRAMPHDLAIGDLLSGGQPYGGAWQAAIGYIMTDLDHWPGWHHGWSPGNPNFHTDKYMPGVMAGAAMLDHPHAQEWLAFGKDNFMDDLDKVLFPPDGVGYECPGYSGYSLKLQLETALLYKNLGVANVVADNPLFIRTGDWHRKLLTPYHTRLGRRHAAPHGDTHRWDSGLGSEGFGRLAFFMRNEHPEAASRFMGTRTLLPTGKQEGSLAAALTSIDESIPAMDPAEMDWSSQYFHGFGTIMRTHFDTPRETFLSFKAGHARGHDHNTELAYHYYANSTPISLDYNCSYSPRGDHAALHNSMTFGRTGNVPHSQSGAAQEAFEQITSTAHVGAFVNSTHADVVVAERKSGNLIMTPWQPSGEFSIQWPSRDVDQIVHRRILALIKHPARSSMTDYLVVRDETRSSERQQLNIHLLAREAVQDGNRIDLWGQWEMDMSVYLAHATDPKVENREWFYWDGWPASPGEPYVLREGETQREWKERMQAFMKQHKVTALPLDDWKPVWQNPDMNSDWHALIRNTDGRALMPPPGWNREWLYGECQLWLRIETKPGTPVTWVLYPYPRGTEKPAFDTIEGGVRITVGRESEDILISSEGGVIIRRNGQESVILEPSEIPPLGEIQAGLPPVNRVR